MAVGCRECGSKVSTGANSCPHCGVRHPAAGDPLAALGHRISSAKAPTAVAHRGSRTEGVVAGLMACIFAALGIFTLGIVFVPLAALCSAIGLLLAMAGRSGSGFAISTLGGVLTVIGFVFSPGLWLLVGGALFASKVDRSAAPAYGTIEAAKNSKPVSTLAAPSIPMFVLESNSGDLPWTGPNSWCRQINVLKNIVQSLSDTDAVKNANERVLDFADATTTAIDVKARTFSCHGIAHLSNGQTLPGTFSLWNNTSGDSKWKWMNDETRTEKIITNAADRSSNAKLQSRDRPAEPFEGLWAQTKDECLNEDGPNSRTLIDLGNLVQGKPTPLFDQYENHCLIDRKSGLGESTTLAMTCFEFWEDFTNRKEGRKATIKLSRSSGTGLGIDGKMYQRCEAQPFQSNVAADSWTKPTPISSLSDYANHVKHRWVKYAEENTGAMYQTSYIDLASIIRTGDTLTVLDLQDWNPNLRVWNTGEILRSSLHLVRYDCGSTPRSMIMAGIVFHGHMASGSQQRGAVDVPTEPSDGWHVLTAHNSDGKPNLTLKARDIACNAS
jgi:hypothetical protein